MKIEILSTATEDLVDGYHFYERQAAGLGNYFLDSLYSDIDSLLVYAGIHRVVYGAPSRSASPTRFTTRSRRIPFASAPCWIAGEALLGLVKGCV
jgi:hypothetical protein